MEITITRTQNPKEKPKSTELKFGKLFSDHMFVCDYDRLTGWHDARIVPFQNLSLSPASMVFHYGQEMFEGLKAYLTSDKRVLLFRPMQNIKRMNNTNARMCIPYVDSDFALEAIKTLINVDRDWVPEGEGNSLYIRPFIIATDPYLGVHPSHTYKFVIILAPSGAYYAQGLKPVRILVEDEYVRAVRGGTGFAKVGGNYAASLLSQKKAEEQGFAQVLWLDGVEHKYVDEVGAMNVFFVINGEVITPSLLGSILPGITRLSAIELLRSQGYKVSERRISMDEIYEASQKGTLTEMFGTGTAAVVSPVGELVWGDKQIIINNNEIGPISKKLYQDLTDIQWGRAEDKFGWVEEV